MTLREQVVEAVMRNGARLGFDRSSAESCADTAVEICGSDDPVDAAALDAVLREVMRIG